MKNNFIELLEMKIYSCCNEKVTYGLNRSVGKSEERISELEDRSEKITPNASQGEKWKL